jgi:hypothetical protein
MADAAEEVERDGGSPVKDLFAGAVGGVAQVLIGELDSFIIKSTLPLQRE